MPASASLLMIGWACLLILTVSVRLGAQVTVAGILTDSASGGALPYVAVTVAEHATPDVTLAYAYTGEDGRYRLTVPIGSGAVRLKAYAMGYRQRSRLLYLQDATNAQVVADFVLVPESHQLSQVTVTAAAPILVRGDTTVYDIEHFTEARDITLEDVLDRIPGIKILPDGNIRVDGRTVDKVLLQGKELSGGGAALLTRGISAADVAEVEVRFDEQDAKLKESLLDSRELVVLDIKLRSTVDESLFGRAVATAGYGQGPGFSPGGNANAFSLSPKLNLQVFGESDQFGAQQISLKDLNNIGREAYAAQFNLPADFATLTEREGYQSELYGFRDFVKRQYHVVGLSAQYDLDSATTLYAGTFNAYDGFSRASATTQDFLSGATFGFAEANQLGQFGSKNKLEFKTTTDRLRWNTDLNAVYTSGDARASFLVDDADNRFRDNFSELDFYANSLLELRHKAAAGLSLRLGFADEAQRSNVRLVLPGTEFGAAYEALLGGSVSDLRQRRDARHQTMNANLGMRLPTRLGAIRPGVRYQGRRLTTSKLGASDSEAVIYNTLTVAATERTAHQLTPHVGYDFDVAGWGVTADIGYALARYPLADGGSADVRQAVEMESAVNGAIGRATVTGTYTRSLSPFPLYQTVPGVDLLGIQTLAAVGSAALRPQLQSVASVSADLKLGSTLDVSSAVLAGTSRTGGRFDAGFAPLSVERYDQLPASYLLVSNIIDWRPRSWPARLTFEPEWLANRQEVRAPGEFSGYTVLTRRTLLGVKLRNPIASKYKYFAYAKYSNFDFSVADSDASLGRLSFGSLQATPKFDLIGGRLRLDPSARVIHLLGEASSTNLLLDVDVEHPGDRFDVSLSATNLLNSEAFTRRTLNPLFLGTERAALFGRAVQLSVRYGF